MNKGLKNRKRTHHQMSLPCKAINKIKHKQTKDNERKIQKANWLRQWFLSGGGFAPQGAMLHTYVCFLQGGGRDDFTGI